MRILVADDDRVTRRILEAHLTKWGHDCVLCSDGASALRMLESDEAPRLAILDRIMPDMDGVEICRRIRRAELKHYIYIILLTSRRGQHDVVEGLDAGADDYIGKPFDPNELRMRVRAGARIIELQERLNFALEEEEFKASHDALTGLLNRGAILETLRKEMARSTRMGNPASIIIADIDHFKKINDQYGHLTGDFVLREAANRLKNEVRIYDSVGRYGGEEFLMVIPGCGLKEASKLAERIRRKFAEALTEVREGAFRLTMSFGVATAYPLWNHSEDDLIRLADEALYRAKEKGRNRVETAPPFDVPLTIVRGNESPDLGLEVCAE